MENDKDLKKEITINDFTDNEINGQTAQEVYQEWLDNKDKPPKQEPTEVEQLQKQLLETQALVAELRYKSILKENGGI
ncbi:hypothetical protein FDB28_10175 [Clostridium botulinum]|nr:hypothetical protein [Clostridium botulinum]NFS96546.1 hypothetical protein [Clostridium botulinum]